MKINNTKTKIRSTVKKVTKSNTPKAKLETVTFNMKKHLSAKSSLLSESSKQTYNVYEIAKKMKTRLSNVAKRLTNDSSPVISNNTKATNTPMGTMAATIITKENNTVAMQPKSPAPLNIITSTSIPVSTPMASPVASAATLVNDDDDNNNEASKSNAITTNMTEASLSHTSPTCSSSVSSESSLIKTPSPTNDDTSLQDYCQSLPKDELNLLLSKVSAVFYASQSSALPLDSPPTSPIMMNATTATTESPMLATADWSNNNTNNKKEDDSKSTSTTTSLHHLHLLKQYLTFVSQETESIQLNENGSINLTFSTNENEMITPESDNQQASRLGATLIELSVHDPIMKIDYYNNNKAIDGHHLKNPNQASRSNNHRRRPGRPPKSSQILINNDKSNQLKTKEKRKHQAIIQRQQRQAQQQKAISKKKDTINCICNKAHEEFGTMVQCDDCLSWLHLDCLELDEKALEETFRCPSCFIQFGANGNNDEAKLLSTVTWRYAAKHQSEVLAGRLTQTEKEDDEDDEYDDEEDMMDIDCAITTHVSIFSYVNDTTPSVVPNVVPDAVSLFDIRMLPDNTAVSPPPSNSNNDWCDSLSNSSCSEAGTPSDHQAGSDDYYFAPPSAANVFLWENNNNMIMKNFTSNNPTLALTTTPTLTHSLSATDIEPSAVCAQELPEFNFWDATYY